MSDNEIESYISQLDKALQEAERAMLQDKALHGASVVIAGSDGIIKEVPAKDILTEND